MYAKPGQIGGRRVGQDDDEEDESLESVLEKSKRLDNNLKGGKNKQSNKQQAAILAEQQRKEKEEALARKRQEVKGPQKTDAQKEEERLLKAFRDKVVNMNPPDLAEVDEEREPASLVFIGHVDAGKSTICGNLMFLTGMVDERTIEKFKQEAKDKQRDSWWLAYVMDSNDEEKQKGKTVEVGRA